MIPKSVLIAGAQLMVTMQLLGSPSFIEWFDTSVASGTPIAGSTLAANGNPTLSNPPGAARAEAARMQTKINLYIAESAKGFDKNVQGALKKVDGPGRQLLALRGYLRGKATLKSRWTWTPAQIKKYRKSSEYARAVAEVARVKMTFAMLNPGYELKVNTEVRTLEEQIKLWNTNKPVEKAGNALLAAATKELSDSTAYTEIPDRKSLRDFVALVRDFKVPSLPTVATPGLSQHGQLRAFDFIIVQGDQIIAGASTGGIGAIWDKSGWTEKLKVAITTASTKFSGPLAAPREPWHYTYMP
jgi:hypothetical protein